MHNNNVQSPHANRGVENTRDNPLIACVDWLSVTFSSEKNVLELFDILRVEKCYFKHQKKNRFNYTDCYTSDLGINIYFCSEDINEVGSFLEVSGQGCRYIEQNWVDGYNWTDFFNLLKILGFRNITRLDVAIDDFKGYLDITKMYRLTKRGCMTSTAGMRTFKYFETGLIDTGETIGETLYVGSNKTEIMFRFYDKLAERTSKLYKVDESITFWNRYEIQTRGERAMNLFNIIASGGFEIGQSVMGIMKHYITFRVKSSKDSNKARWKVQPFWNKFLKDVEPLKLTKVHPEINFYKTRNWLIDSVSSNLALLYDAYGQDISVIENLIDFGRNKQNEKHELMLNQFLNDEFEKFNREEEFYLNLSKKNTSNSKFGKSH